MRPSLGNSHEVNDSFCFSKFVRWMYCQLVDTTVPALTACSLVINRILTFVTYILPYRSAPYLTVLLISITNRFSAHTKYIPVSLIRNTPCCPLLHSLMPHQAMCQIAWF